MRTRRHAPTRQSALDLAERIASAPAPGFFGAAWWLAATASWPPAWRDRYHDLAAEIRAGDGCSIDESYARAWERALESMR